MCDLKGVVWRKKIDYLDEKEEREKEMAGFPEIKNPMTEEDKKQEAVKFDSMKLRFDLIPPDALEELAKIYTIGAGRYGDRNWEKGMNWGRIYAALQRHLNSFWGGQDFDEDECNDMSHKYNTYHLAHAAWCCLTLLSYQIRSIGHDERGINTIDD